MYKIVCPNCGEDDINMIEYNYFECACGEEFDIERANVEEIPNRD